jgi:hypothetical protein
LLYPATYNAPYAQSAERRTIELHLEELVAQERVRALEDQRFVAL